MKTLTRTDFLIQFVWKPTTADTRPKTEEDRVETVKKLREDLTKAEKNNPAVGRSRKTPRSSSRRLAQEVGAARVADDQGARRGAGAPGTRRAGWHRGPGAPCPARPPGPVAPRAGRRAPKSP